MTPRPGSPLGSVLGTAIALISLLILPNHACAVGYPPCTDEWKDRRPNEEELRRSKPENPRMLCYAELDRANLNGANLAGANLTGAKLKGASLVNADLTSALLIGTNMTEANLWDANLTNANLVDARL